MKMIFTTQSGRGALRIGVNPCGKCQHIGFCEAFSEWWCKKWNRSLGHNYRPIKGHFCDVIGQDGDTKEIKAMFECLFGLTLQQ